MPKWPRMYKNKKTLYKYKKEGRRTNADRVLAQGMGKTAKKAFGNGNGSKTSYNNPNLSLKCWDAFDPCHLALPRSVGPYTVVRTTCNFTSSDRIIMITPTAFNNANASNLKTNNAWSTVCAIHSVNSGLAINAANNVYLVNAPFPGVTLSSSALTATPSAISVQVMNPNALQTTSGMVFGAVCPTSLDLRGRSETWAAFGEDIISFMKPRMMSAGKLALRGVQADSYPLDMTDVSDFRNIFETPNGTTTLGDAFHHVPEAWAPIVIVNKGSTLDPPLDLNFLVTIEWRVRFDISNPAVASHINHGVTSDNTWDKMIQKASARAHGMLDIAERVANLGSVLAAAT